MTQFFRSNRSKPIGVFTLLAASLFVAPCSTDNGTTTGHMVHGDGYPGGIWCDGKDPSTMPTSYCSGADIVVIPSESVTCFNENGAPTAVLNCSSG